MTRSFSWRRFLALLLAGLSLYYVYRVADFYVNQSKYVYRPVARWAETPAAYGIAFEDVTLKTSDGVALSAWYMPAERARGTVLILHGNARNMSSDMDVVEMFHVYGFNVLIFDYRGYGKSQGVPTEEGTYLDAQAAWDWLVTRGERPERIVLCGRSLGAAVAAHLASRNGPGALFIEGAFTSVTEVGQELYPYFPVKWFSRFKYDARGSVSGLDVPLLIIHSRNDEIVPFHHAQRLVEAANGNATLVEIGGPHRGGYKPTREKYLRGVKDFLNGLFPPGLTD